MASLARRGKQSTERINYFPEATEQTRNGRENGFFGQADPRPDLGIRSNTQEPFRERSTEVWIQYSRVTAFTQHYAKNILNVEGSSLI